jgi:hypothetical protein
MPPRVPVKTADMGWDDSRVLCEPHGRDEATRTRMISLAYLEVKGHGHVENQLPR